MIKTKLKRIVTTGLVALMMLIFTPNVVKAIPTENKAIVLDMAHLDTKLDNGASYNGITEREQVQEITLMLKDELESRGFNIQLTRDENTPISIADRVNSYSKSSQDFYISIHLNSTETPNKGYGSETFSTNTYKLSKDILKDLEKFGLKNRGVKETPYYNKYIDDSLILELGFINSSDIDIILNNKEDIVKSIADNIQKQYIHIENNIKKENKSKRYKEITETKEVTMPDGRVINKQITKYIEIGA